MHRILPHPARPGNAGGGPGWAAPVSPSNRACLLQGRVALDRVPVVGHAGVPWMWSGPGVPTIVATSPAHVCVASDAWPSGARSPNPTTSDAANRRRPAFPTDILMTMLLPGATRALREFVLVPMYRQMYGF